MKTKFELYLRYRCSSSTREDIIMERVEQIQEERKRLFVEGLTATDPDKMGRLLTNPERYTRKDNVEGAMVGLVDVVTGETFFCPVEDILG